MRQIKLHEIDTAKIKHKMTADQEIVLLNYKAEAIAKQIEPALEMYLLNEIRNGNSDAIPKLVNSWEHIIVSIIERQNIGLSISIETMFNTGKQCLTLLAEQELDSVAKERFFRFGVWYVQQAILKLAN